MYICIIYDTKREKGATKQIVNWMAEAAGKTGVKVDVRRPSEVNNFDYDLIVIGSPIYYEKPMKSIVNFISENKDVLSGKKIALFVICIAQIFGHYTKGYVEKRYLGQLVKKLPDLQIKGGMFKGWLKFPDYKQKEICMRWIQEVIKDAKRR